VTERRRTRLRRHPRTTSGHPAGTRHRYKCRFIRRRSVGAAVVARVVPRLKEPIGSLCHSDVGRFFCRRRTQISAGRSLSQFYCCQSLEAARLLQSVRPSRCSSQIVGKLTTRDRQRAECAEQDLGGGRRPRSAVIWSQQDAGPILRAALHLLQTETAVEQCASGTAGLLDLSSPRDQHYAATPSSIYTPAI